MAAVAPALAGFTMMEIAISLAIIGIALVAIIGVLPIGMNVQQTNRQDTIVNQDAQVLIEDIRNGSLGADDLTNYVFAITNYWVQYNPDGTIASPPGTENDYTYRNAQTLPVGTIYPFKYPASTPPPLYPIKTGANIIGLLSTPEFMDIKGNATNNLFSGGYSNHIIACVYSISGPAAQKPPQDNPIMQQDSFAYRLYCVNAPVPVNTNDFFMNPNQRSFDDQLAASLHELRMTFYYPLLPNGKLGAGQPKTYRTQIAGRLVTQPVNGPVGGPITNNPSLYMYQSQSFQSTTNVP